MDYESFYQENHTYITELDDRLEKVVEIARENNPGSILDVGCGGGVLLRQLQNVLPSAELSGTDVYEQEPEDWSYAISDVTKRIEFPDASFDMVIAGEIIEHVPDPDFFIRECRRVLKDDGLLIVTTPNLVSWANRLMVLSGTQPFFTETSNQKNLGRRSTLLGQDGKTQGHLKIFTHLSLEEILDLNEMKVITKVGSVFFFPFPLNLVDKAASRCTSLASSLIYTSRKSPVRVESDNASDTLAGSLVSIG